MSQSLKTAWERAKDVVFARGKKAGGWHLLNPFAQLWHAKHDRTYGDCRELAQMWALATALLYGGAAAATYYILKDPVPKVEIKMQQPTDRNNTARSSPSTPCPS